MLGCMAEAAAQAQLLPERAGCANYNASCCTVLTPLTFVVKETSMLQQLSTGQFTQATNSAIRSRHAPTCVTS